MKSARDTARDIVTKIVQKRGWSAAWTEDAITQAIIAARTEMQRNALAKASEAITACGEAEIRATGSKDFCQGLYQGRLRLIELRSAIRSLNPEGEPQEAVEAK